MTNDEQDLQPNGRRSIRDIPIPRRRPAPAARATDDVRPVRVAREPDPVDDSADAPLEADDAPLPPPLPRRPMPVRDDAPEAPEPPRAYRAERPRRRRRAWVKLALGLAVVAVGVWLLTWHSATVTVAERQASRSINITLPVSTSGAATGTLPATAVNVITRAERALPATGEATVQSKAGGTITIYNDYSAEPQTLVRNTRFQTPDGLVFRIQEPVTVPGKKSSGPGTIEARVTADEVGDRYNVGPVARFTIPGFAGKPQFDSFYAASAAPMTGGASGIQKVADPAAVAKAVDELTEELRGKMAAEAAKKAGAGFQAFAVPGSFAVLATGREPQGETVTVWVEAQADAFAVSERDFADAVAAQVLTGYRAKGEARIDSPQALRVTPKEGASPALEVIGTAEVTWLVDQNTLRASLLGQPLASFDQIIGRYGGAERAKPVVRPFWRSTFPTDIDDVKIVIESGDDDVDE